MPSGKGVASRLGRKVLSLLEEGRRDAKRRGASQGAAATSADAGPWPADQLLGRLGDMVKQGDELVAGRVTFLDLDTLKEDLGDRWEAMADRIDTITRRAIEHRLAPSDMYSRLSGHRYLILFSGLSPAEAQLKCALIGEEISKRLLGETDEGPAIRVQTAVSRLGGAVEVETVPPVERLAESLYAQIATPASRATAEAALDAVPQGQDDPLHGVRLVYRPMWNVRSNVVSTYIYVPAMAMRSGGLAVGEGIISRIEEATVVFDLDLMVMRQLVEDLAELQETGLQLLLAAPVHFETLATSGRRTAYMRLCQVIPPAQRRYVLFELVDVPPGIPQSRLLEIATSLRRYARAVLLRTSLIDPVLRPAGETGVLVVGVSMTEFRMPEKQTMKAMDRFCEAAQKAGLQTYIHGLNKLSLTTAAVGAGFDHVDGDIVTSVVEVPGGLYHFDTRSLFRSLAGGKGKTRG